jgi:hypothetical protein
MIVMGAKGIKTRHRVNKSGHIKSIPISTGLYKLRDRTDAVVCVVAKVQSEGEVVSARPFALMWAIVPRE